MIEAGCDEVGRGCLAGPVAAAAVILPPDFQHQNLIDSKKLNATKREQMRQLIEDNALAYAISFVLPQTIDRINILRASFLGMNRAVNRLKLNPELLLIDGNRFYSGTNIPFQCIVKGDSKVGSIAAASILAKCYRDEYMYRLANQFPHFGWETNVGYPTPKHKAAILDYGLTSYHRKSYKFNHQQLALQLD